MRLVAVSDIIVIKFKANFNRPSRKSTEDNVFIFFISIDKVVLVADTLA